MKKALRKIITGAAIIASSYMSMKAIAQEKIENNQESLETTLEKNDIEFGLLNFNLQAGVNNELDSKLRTIVGVKGNYNDLEIVYSGLHDLKGMDNYFSRNVISVGKSTSSTKPCIIIKATDKGIFETQYGLRNTSIHEKIGADYGWITLSGNKDVKELAFLLGKDLGRGITAEMMNSYHHKDNLNIYAEIQFDKKITKHISGFGRVELGISKKDPQTVYVIGLKLNK